MPQLNIRDSSGVSRQISRIRMRDANGVLQTIQQIRIRDSGGTLRTVYSPYSATISPASVSAYGSSGATANLTTGAAVATPSGGISPYIYAWTQVGASPYTWTIANSAAANTTFTCTNLPAGVSTSAVFQCAVKETGGNYVYPQVSAVANNGQPYQAPITGTGTQPKGQIP